MERSEYIRYKRLIKKIILVQENGDCCSRCKNKFDYEHYDFHHLDPNEKEIGVAQMMGYNLDEIRKEVSKCILVCKECHRIIHKEMEGSREEEEQKLLAELIRNNLDDFTNDSGQIKFKKIINKMQE